MSEPRPADSVLMGNAAHVDVHAPRGPLGSRRLLRLAGDDRLVAQIRRGSEAAFEVAFERHGPAILAFCRHMLGSREEAEDAVQHTFAAAYSDLQRGRDRRIVLKPWLFTIARNRCLSVLRARRELPQGDTEIATAGLAEQVEQRAELRELLADIRELPDEQRAALLLAEVGGLAQADIASVLGCEAARVKALVYRARSGLLARREARELPCERVREQLSELRGGSLRRTELQLHLRECQGCREFRAEVKRQRQMLAVALPVAPTLGLKSSVLGAVGIGGGAAAAGGTAAGGAAAGGAAVGSGAALAGVAKVAAVALVAAGGTAVVVHEREAAPPQSPPPNSSVTTRDQSQTPAPTAVERSTTGEATSPERAQSVADSKGKRRGHERAERAQHRNNAAESAPGQLKAPGERARPVKPKQAAEKGGNGRGAIEAPPQDTPVRRGPPEPKVREQAAPKVHEAPIKPDKVERHGPKLE
jgi:RNA polymerase sigma factor (sigma-70 family)